MRINKLFAFMATIIAVVYGCTVNGWNTYADVKVKALHAWETGRAKNCMLLTGNPAIEGGKATPDPREMLCNDRRKADPDSMNWDYIHISTVKLDETFGKTPAARRKLTMTGKVYSILKERALSAKSRYAFPSPANPSRPIGRVHKAHYGAVDRARIKPRFILYDLRHTYASHAVMAGVDLPTLAALLGHTSIQMTMRYVHPAEEHKREAAGKLENYKAGEILKLTEKSQRVSAISATVQRVN
jgi:hypothetical protein